MIKKKKKKKEAQIEWAKQADRGTPVKIHDLSSEVKAHNSSYILSLTLLSKCYGLPYLLMRYALCWVGKKVRLVLPM